MCDLINIEPFRNKSFYSASCNMRKLQYAYSSYGALLLRTETREHACMMHIHESKILLSGVIDHLSIIRSKERLVYIVMQFFEIVWMLPVTEGISTTIVWVGSAAGNGLTVIKNSIESKRWPSVDLIPLPIIPLYLDIVSMRMFTLWTTAQTQFLLLINWEGHRNKFFWHAEEWVIFWVGA